MFRGREAKRQERGNTEMSEHINAGISEYRNTGVQKCRKRLLASRGETLIEALVACLIVALAIGMIAQVMVTAARVVQKSQTIQANNNAIMNAFWKDSSADGKKTGSLNGKLDFNEFSISVNLMAYDINTNVSTSEGAGSENRDVSGTVYEFQTSDN